MKPLAITRKIILEYLREPLLLGLIFAFPVILLLFYAIAFGETDQGMAKHLKIMVLNQDAGYQGDEGDRLELGKELIRNLKAENFEGSPVFDMQEVETQSQAEITLRDQKAVLLLVIPTDFSRVLLTAGSGDWTGKAANLSLVGYPSSNLYAFTRSYLEGFMAAYADKVAGWNNEILTIEYAFVPGTGTMSDFEFGVPGLIVFGIMLIATTTAMTMVREEVNGTLKRIRLTGLSARDLFLGVSGAQMVISIILVPFTFVCALLLGFHGNGSILLAILVGVLLSLAAIGVGLLTACFARNDGEAANLSAIVGVMMVILSGAMYPMPKAPITTIGGQTIQIYDLLPTAHASEALRRILIYGDGFGAITYQVGALVVLSALIFAAGIWLYQKIKL